MKKTISILLVMLLLVSALTGCGGNNKDNNTLNNQTETAKQSREVAKVSYHKAAESFAGGSGTEADPFQISEVGHLVLLHEMLKKKAAENNFDKTYVEGHFVLTADISLNDTSDFENWSTNAPEYGWEPIGVASTYFSGVLDGNGHKITGMFIDADSASTANAYYGLFSQLEGTVKNLTVEDSYICVSGDTAEVGTIAGYTYNSVIENCSANTDITLYGAATAGGIVGNGTIVTSCTFSGSVAQLDNGVSVIGGIAGHIGGNAEVADRITDCTFSGTLSGNGHTGGILGFGENAANCVNKGSVSGDVAGGIVGRAYCVGTNLELKNTSYAIENCTNEGQVTGVSLAGGIVGWLGNSESDISMSVIGCENKGSVQCDESVAGVIGRLSAERAGAIKIENCVNHADINGKGKTGGIICELTGAILHQEGNVVVSGCKNLGDIISEDQYSAGVVTYLMIMGNAVDLRLTLDSCTNEGAVESTTYAGGIIGYSDVGFGAEVSAKNMKISDATKLLLNKCSNTGKVTVTTINAMAGGIVGVLGSGYLSTEITDCTNTGSVAIVFTLTDEQIAESQGAAWTEFYQIGGGIVGRIGDALKLTTAEGVETSADNVNAKNANIKITGCSSTGTISAPDYSTILNQWKKPLYANYLGGIVGQCSATDGYAFSVENCTYSGAERGLGDAKYPDFGTKN